MSLCIGWHNEPGLTLVATQVLVERYRLLNKMYHQVQRDHRAEAQSRTWFQERSEKVEGELVTYRQAMVCRRRPPLLPLAGKHLIAAYTLLGGIAE